MAGLMNEDSCGRIQIGNLFAAFTSTVVFGSHFLLDLCGGCRPYCFDIALAEYQKRRMHAVPAS